MLTLWKESYHQPRQHIKKQRHYFSNKGPSSQGYGFSCGHVWMWELDCEESWGPKNWCFWTVVLEKTLESPLDSKEIQPVHPKGDQSWVFIGRTDAESERINTCVYFPIYVVTQYWAEFSVLYSRSLLVSHFKYSSVYMSIPNSLTVPSPNLPLC